MLRAAVTVLIIAGGGAAAANCDQSAWGAAEQAAFAAAIDGEPYAVPADDRTDFGPFVKEALICPDFANRLRGPGLVLIGARLRSLDLAGRDIGAAFTCRDCWIGQINARDSRWAHSLALDGAQVGALDFSGASFGDDLSLRGVVAAADAPISMSLDGARLARAADLAGVRLRGGLSAAEAQVGEALDLAGSRIRGAVTLDGVRVGGGLSLIGAESGGPVSGLGASVGGALRADALTALALDLEGVSTGGALVLSGAVVSGSVDLDKARVGGDVWIRRFDGGPDPEIAAEGAEVALSMNNASVGGRIDVSGARFGGAVSLDAVRIAEDLWLRHGSAVDGPVVGVFARIGQNVDFSGTDLGDVDLTGAAIGGELRLGAPGADDGPGPSGLPPPQWREGARLWLRNASATAIVDASAECGAIDAWPASLDLSGFGYARIGGLGGGDERVRERCGFHTAWLARQDPFSLDPYRRLADLLDNGGRAAAARAVRWAAKERQLSEARGLEWVRLGLQRIFVGYGIYSYLVFVWMIALAVFGAAIFSRSPEAKTSVIPLGLLFSTDVLLPFVSFRQAHDQVDFTSVFRWYYYFHKFMGWVFALFFVSALSGLFAV